MKITRLDFDKALSWHRVGKQTSPRARSVHLTDAILSELDEAIRLLRLFDEGKLMRGEVSEFLYDHSDSPYKR